MSSWTSPCAACKIQRRKCTQECVFAPYFPPDNPQKFAYVHKVFGASNVAKLLNEVNASQREDAVKSLAYEAEARLRDPVYGCVGLISLLQHKLKQMQNELSLAKKELASYIGPQAMLPPPPPLPPPVTAQRNASLFPFTVPSSQQPQDVFSFNFEGNSAGSSSFHPHIQTNPFQQLMISSQQPQQPQPHRSIFSQKLLKSESDNLGEA